MDEDLIGDGEEGDMIGIERDGWDVKVYLMILDYKLILWIENGNYKFKGF